MEKTKSTGKSRTKNFSYKMPLLFTIPLDVYSDEVEKVRDKETFLKIQELEKKCQQLRQKFNSYSESHLQRIKLTRSLISRTLQVSKKMSRYSDDV